MRRSLRTVFLLAAFVLAMPLLAAAGVSFTGLRDQIADADIVVVPGNKVHPDGTLSKRLKARCDVALKIYRDGRANRILVSGGTGIEGVDEAAAMKGYLIDQGVPADHILQDSQGYDSEATAQNAARMLAERGYSRVIVATQFFHIERMSRLLKEAGLTVSGHEHARYFEARDAYSLPREVAALAVLGYEDMRGRRPSVPASTAG